MMKNWIPRRPEPPLNAVDLDDLEAKLRGVSGAPGMPRPADEFAPQRMEYSLDRVASFLSRHVKELADAQAALALDAAAAEGHLAEVERRRAITKVAHALLSETLAKLMEKSAALDQPELTLIEPPATEVVP